MKTLETFRLDHRVAIITGGAGLMGRKHAEAVIEAGGSAVLWDIDTARLESAVSGLGGMPHASADVVDITSAAAIEAGVARVLARTGRIDILINNAAVDPKADGSMAPETSRFERLPLDVWERDIAVGLTGAFLCSQIIGARMASTGAGVILNIASDLALISPDQRLYRVPGVAEDRQPVKPVTYSVVKHGLIGLTRYLATYWAGAGVRVNAISPGGIRQEQSEEFVQRISALIPLGRMAHVDEYKAAVVFLVSDASSYMTGTNLVVEGGRTCW